MLQQRFIHKLTFLLIQYGMIPFSLFFILFQISPAWARLDQIPGSRYTSAQVAAQGDAALGLPEDVMSGLFYNPAILGKIKKPKLTLLDIAFSPSFGLLTSSGVDFKKMISLNEAKSFMSSHLDQSFGSSGRYSLSFGVSGFAVGLLVQAEAVGKALDPQLIFYRSSFQVIPSIGYGRSFFRGLLRLGYSLQWVNQASGVGVGSLQDSISYTSGLTQGSGFAHQAGLAFTFPMMMLPELDLVARNIGGLQYSSSSWMRVFKNSVGTPPSEPMTLDGVLTLHPAFGAFSILNLSLAYRDITHQSSARVRDHVAAGAELLVAQRVMLRGGMRGVYPSFGLGFRGRRADLSLTYYSENAGLGSLEVKNTQVVFQYSIRAF